MDSVNLPIYKIIFCGKGCTIQNEYYFRPYLFEERILIYAVIVTKLRNMC